MGFFSKLKNFSRTTKDAGRQLAVKKVLRQGKTFVCGICRNTYPSQRTAQQCLSRCLENHKTRSVVVDKSKDDQVYKCSFCYREYPSETQAHRCAQECKAEIAKNIATRTALYQSKNVSATEMQRARGKLAAGAENFQAPGIDSQNRKKKKKVAAVQQKTKTTNTKAQVRRNALSKFFRDGRNLICKKCGNSYRKLDDVIACFDGHPDSMKPQKIELDPKKYRREGLNYICRYCGESYESYPEVAKCFDAHDRSSGKSETISIDKSKYHREGNKFVCAYCGDSHNDLSAVESCYDSHDRSIDSPKVEGDKGGLGYKMETTDITAEPIEDAKFAPIEQPESVVSAPSEDEVETVGQEETTKPEEQPAYRQEGDHFVCSVCNTKYFSEAEAQMCFATHEGEFGDDIDIGVADISESNQSVDEGPDPNDDKFYRDGAKYVCKQCNQKYFTRVEVVNCFDGHNAE